MKALRTFWYVVRVSQFHNSIWNLQISDATPFLADIMLDQMATDKVRQFLLWFENLAMDEKVNFIDKNYIDISGGIELSKKAVAKKYDNEFKYKFSPLSRALSAATTGNNSDASEDDEEDGNYNCCDSHSKIEMRDKEIAELKDIRANAEIEIAELKETSTNALLKFKKSHDQQSLMYEEFLSLHSRFKKDVGELEEGLVDTLWNKCAPYNVDLKGIPHQQKENFVENDKLVGEYNIGKLLQEAKFSRVHSCTLFSSPPKGVEVQKDYAVKIIDKTQIITYNSILRVAKEVQILNTIRHNNIAKLRECIHTKNNLYIITENDGQEMFEFIDEFPDGVPEAWAKEIMKNLLAGVTHCHNHGICHRDIKPENIIMKFDSNNSSLTSLKLCNFGMSAKFNEEWDTKKPFTVFCGSPGFFAPEMITRGYYYNIVDVWSCGSVMLELILGTDRFDEIWMPAYALDVMQDKTSFASAIDDSLNRVHADKCIPAEMKQFVLEQLLVLSVSQRKNTKKIMTSNWLNLSDAELIECECLENRVHHSFNPVKCNSILEETILSPESHKRAQQNMFLPPIAPDCPSWYSTS